MGVSHNTYYRIYKGHYTISKIGRAFRERVRNSVRASAPSKPLTEPIKLRLLFAFKDKRRRDLDNYQKALIDALKGVVFADDSQIFVLTSGKVIGVRDEIRIEWCPYDDS
jgi:crossover junction endodeoxyribonuclease RusA